MIGAESVRVCPYVITQVLYSSVCRVGFSGRSPPLRRRKTALQMNKYPAEFR